MSLEIIKKYHISAKKSLWQNFLVDENITSQIAKLIHIMWSDIVEVGPGYWSLTEKLVEKKPRSLHLVELDNDMVHVLQQRKESWEISTEWIDFQIHNTDILEFSPNFRKYSVIANIPYYITSPILRHFMYQLEHMPEQMCILMQKDVGDKILGKWKNKSSVLSLMVEKKYYATEKIFVPKESFIPQPKIESSVLFFEKHNHFSDVDDNIFLDVIKKWFCEPRKKLLKNLVKWWFEKDKILTFLKENNIREDIRGEDMSVKMWCLFVQKI